MPSIAMIHGISQSLLSLEVLSGCVTVLRDEIWNDLSPNRDLRHTCVCVDSKLQVRDGYKYIFPRDQCLLVDVDSIYWPLSKTFTLPSPPTKYKSSFPIAVKFPSLLNSPPAVILMTPLTSLAVPVSSNLKLTIKSAL